MQLKLRSVVKGLASTLPVLSSLANSRAGDAVNARYYYSVWMRHLVSVAEVSDDIDPACVAELGPGDSLGLGLAAMLCGANRYFALDRLQFANSTRNLEVFDELVELFRARAAIPDDSEFPKLYPRLNRHDFPSDLLDETRLSRSLDPHRLSRIRKVVEGGTGTMEEIEIRYFAPWDDAATLRPESVDWIFSQAVLEHVDDVDGTCASLRTWLRPGGLMSHRIDYSCHGLTHDWNGHWTVSSPMWRVVRGRRAYLINRLPHSSHLRALAISGFRVLLDRRSSGKALSRSLLAPDFVDLDNRDLETTGAFVVSVKPGVPR